MDLLTQIRLNSAPDSDADQLDIEQSVLNLKRELLDLDIGTIENEVTKAPGGSKSGGAVDIAALVVKLFDSSGVVGSVIDTIASWLTRTNNYSVTMEIDNDKIEIKGINSEQQQQLIDSWIQRHSSPKGENG